MSVLRVRSSPKIAALPGVATLEISESKVLRVCRNVKVWDTKNRPIRARDPKTGKEFGPVFDYLDVIVEGYASTFGDKQLRDRGGDYVMPGAWKDAFGDFKKNPVMLKDHENSTDSVVGSWTSFRVTSVGLAVSGRLSNAPSLRDLRVKVVEGHLKGLSIGGVWSYLSDG